MSEIDPITHLISNIEACSLFDIITSDKLNIAAQNTWQQRLKCFIGLHIWGLTHCPECKRSDPILRGAVLSEWYSNPSCHRLARQRANDILKRRVIGDRKEQDAEQH